ncbi:hypothetical protein [Brevibacillus borstelensis]
MIKVVMIEHSRYHPVQIGEANDCIVLRRFSTDSNTIDIALPFLEDTPNIQLSIVDAIMLRNAIDELVNVKMLERTGGTTV